MTAFVARSSLLDLTVTLSPRDAAADRAAIDRAVASAEVAVARSSRALTRANARLVAAHRARDAALERERGLVVIR